MTDSDPSDDDKVTLSEMGPYDAVEVQNVWPNHDRCVPIEVLEELVERMEKKEQILPSNEACHVLRWRNELQEIIDNHE